MTTATPNIFVSSVSPKAGVRNNTPNIQQIFRATGARAGIRKCLSEFKTAIANAKAALEESFTPHLKDILSQKIREMEEIEEEEITESEPENSDIVEESEVSEEVTEETMEEEVSLDDILEELEEDLKEDTINEAEEEEEIEVEAEEETEDETEEEAEEEAEEETDDEDFEIEDMTEEDLTKFIEEVIMDMVEDGDIEADIEVEDDEVEAEEEIEVEDEEEVEVMEVAPTPSLRETELEGELEEALDTIKALKSDLNEVNVFNSKLLYTNKIFKEKSLTESEKLKVLDVFDKAETVKEAKLVYESLQVKTKAPKRRSPVKESMMGSASKTIANTKTTKQPIVETNAMVNRFQTLAGIK